MKTRIIPPGRKAVYRIVTVLCWVLIVFYFIAQNRSANRITSEVGKMETAVRQEIRTVIRQATPTPHAIALLSGTLSPGDTGDDVRVLQAALSTKNFIPLTMATGYYGEMTAAAVEAFQKSEGLPVTGSVDEATRKAFNIRFGASYDRFYYLSLIPTLVPAAPASNNTTGSGSGPWGVAERVTGTDHAWTMRVGEDPVMATAKEIFDALNTYRAGKKVNGLNWDGALADYSQERADFFIKNGGLDDHKGFNDYLNNQDNVMKLDFYRLGENSSCGYRMTGTHLIEWIFAGDAPHDNNQLNSAWSDVGIGVSGTCVDLVFGGQRIH